MKRPLIQNIIDIAIIVVLFSAITVLTILIGEEKHDKHESGSNIPARMDQTPRLFFRV